MHGSIRQQEGNCVNPTHIQFEGAFRELFTHNYLHSEANNCSDDFDSLLTQFKDLKCENIFVVDEETNKILLDIRDCD